MGNFGTVFDRTIQQVQDRLSLSSVQPKVISSHSASRKTPDELPKQISFEEALRKSVQEQTLRMVRDNAAVDLGDSGLSAESEEPIESSPTDLDTEMRKLSKNNVEYQFIVSMLNKKFGMIRHAMEG